MNVGDDLHIDGNDITQIGINGKKSELIRPKKYNPKSYPYSIIDGTTMYGYHDKKLSVLIKKTSQKRVIFYAPFEFYTYTLFDLQVNYHGTTKTFKTYENIEDFDQKIKPSKRHIDDYLRDLSAFGAIRKEKLLRSSDWIVSYNYLESDQHQLLIKEKMPIILRCDEGSRTDCLAQLKKNPWIDFGAEVDQAKFASIF